MQECLGRHHLGTTLWWGDEKTRTWGTFPCYSAHFGATICDLLHFGREILQLHLFIGFSTVHKDFSLAFTDLSTVFIAFPWCLSMSGWSSFIFSRLLVFPNGFRWILNILYWLFHDFRSLWTIFPLCSSTFPLSLSILQCSFCLIVVHIVLWCSSVSRWFTDFLMAFIFFSKCD